MWFYKKVQAVLGCIDKFLLIFVSKLYFKYKKTTNDSYYVTKRYIRSISKNVYTKSTLLALLN